MSSTRLRKTFKTYSRQRTLSLHDGEPAAKRRRVEVKEQIVEHKSSQAPTLTSSPPSSPDGLTTSSPKEDSIFSDNVPSTSSPPSSPPSKHPSPIRQKSRKPIFSFLKRRPMLEYSPNNPLSETDHNVQRKAPHLPEKKKRLTQMQLDLGGDVRKSCKVCGMDYIPSNAEDAALHRKFHAMNVGGVDLTKAVIEKMKNRQVWAGGDGSFIAEIARNDSAALRTKAVEVLQVVNKELAAVTIPDSELWGQTSIPEQSNALVKGEDGEMSQSNTRTRSIGDRFKVYLYIRGQKCIGACLVERIQEAYTVVDPDDVSGETESSLVDFPSSSISVSSTAEASILGVSRIWTSNLHRHNGIATALLDSATSGFLYGMTVSKEMVAFSQPTESGGQLARNWYGKRIGWHVYVD